MSVSRPCVPVAPSTNTGNIFASSVFAVIVTAVARAAVPVVLALIWANLSLIPADVIMWASSSVNSPESSTPVIVLPSIVNEARALKVLEPVNVWLLCNAAKVL